MKKYLILAAVALVSVACCKRFYPASVTDSVRVNTHYVEKLRDTVIYVDVPREVEKIITRDTVSHLENSVALSDAVISGGLLFHSLETKPATLPTKVQMKEVEMVRDSIIYRVSTIVQEINRLTWWQQTQIRGFQLLLVLVAARGVIYLILKK